MPRYICSLHTNITDLTDKDNNSLSRYYEVNWLGKGCDGCVRDHDKRMAKKELEKKKKAARRAGEVYKPEEEDAYV